ncbi:MAG: hypothetical protein JO021_00045 [Alphaproteobacteria bacterium]|nr:hypothetical protein [Alphaproteobacteria bacterium]
MSRWEWVVIAVMLAIAFAVALTHLDGTLLGRFFAGEPLPELQRSADDRFLYAIFPCALLIWWAAAMFPNRRDFLRTGAYILVAAGIAYALYQYLTGAS